MIFILRGMSWHQGNSQQPCTEMQQIPTSVALSTSAKGEVMMDNDEQSWEEIWDADAQESPHDVADTLLFAVLEAVEPGRALP